MTSRPHELFGCYRHPSQPITGFCASCLRERLQGIEASSSPQHNNPTNANNDHRCPNQLRRTKSCSGRDPLTASEPRRRSCEVRMKNTLSNLFYIDDELKGMNGSSLNLEIGNVGFGIKEEELDEVGERRVSEIAVDESQMDEINEEDRLTMKEFIDLELQNRKSNGSRDFKEIAGSLWEATSTLTKRFRKWGKKHKSRKNSSYDNDDGLMGLKGVKLSVMGFRDTRSKISQHVSRRSSCDTNPRFSIDAGRMSVDDSRFSFDEPRASWDGYLIGKACNPKLMQMVSVMEDGEKQCPSNLSWEGRRRSLDSSISTIRQAISESDELKLIANSKMSPATTALFCGAKLLITEKDLMEKTFGSVGNVESGCDGDNHAKNTSDIVVRTSEKRSKKSRKWRGVLNMLGMMQQKTEAGVEFREGSSSDNIGKISGESRLANGEIRLISHQIIHSSSISCKDQRSNTDFCGTESRETSAKGKTDMMLQRNRPLDNGLLRFHLTPSRSYRRSNSRKSWL